MKQTKYFELTEADAVNAYFIMSRVVDRCAGMEKDPDTGQDWTTYNDVTISIIRSTRSMPEARENHNVVSNNIFKFTVAELAEDASMDNTNPKVSAIGRAVSKLAIRRCSSHFFLKVDLE